MMKTIRLINETDKAARLANVRLRIVRDMSAYRPDEYEDLIFKYGHGEIFGFEVRDSYSKCESFVCCANRKHLMKELDAMNFTTDEQKDKWLKEIREAEKFEYQCWMDGEIYGVIVEKWNEAERNWQYEDVINQIYSWNNVKKQIKDLSYQYLIDPKSQAIDVYCVDDTAGDVNNMLEKYVNVEIYG